MKVVIIDNAHIFYCANPILFAYRYWIIPLRIERRLFNRLANTTTSTWRVLYLDNNTYIYLKNLTKQTTRNYILTLIFPDSTKQMKTGEGVPGGLLAIACIQYRDTHDMIVKKYSTTLSVLFLTVKERQRAL